MTHPVAEDAGHISCTVWTAHGGPVIVTLEGGLDIMSAPVLREQFLSVLRPGASQLIVDLSAIRYADASGLAVLLGSQRRAALLGSALRLAAPQPEVARVLAVTGMSRHFDIYPTVQAAIAGQDPAVDAAGLGTGHTATAAHAPPAQARAEFSADHQLATAQCRAG